MTVACNICGGISFLPGPGGRLSATQKPPRCASCQSLERHRTLRQFYQRLREAWDLSGWSCLQISEDRSIEPAWFASHTVSIYGKSHSVDVQALPFPNRIFDCVVCNHVLEHVPDDRQAMSELLRVVSDRGFVQIGVPDPIRLQTTEDWGYPRWEDHGHFRKYGIDIVHKLEQVAEQGTLIQVVEQDPVTEMDDLDFILTRSASVTAAILSLYPAAVVTGGKPVLSTPCKAERPVFLHGSFLLRNPEAFDSYVRGRENEAIEGWVTPGALGTLAALNGFQQSQGIKGHVCEIGVHHGRYVIAMSLVRTLGEKTLAIDLFEQQELNVDGSGRGDAAVFGENVVAWLGPEPDVVTWHSDSLSITGAEVMERLGGRVRLFSVDGSHTCKHTLNDLKIAEECLAEGGLAIVDDFLNPAWPGVLEAIIRYLDEMERPSKLVPIGYGDNKFYFTTRDFTPSYQARISGMLGAHLTQLKSVMLCGSEALFFAMTSAERLLRASPLGVNEMLQFGIGAVERPILLGRWGAPEKSGSWALGEWAGIAIDVGEAGGDHAVRLALRLCCFRHKHDPLPQLTVHAFAHQLAKVEFPNGVDQQELVLEIDRRIIGADNRLEVWFRNLRTASPLELGVSTDPRPLSFLALHIQRNPLPQAVADGLPIS